MRIPFCRSHRWYNADGTDHFIAAAYKDRHCPGICALLDDQHLLLCRPECDFFHQTRAPKLLRCQILEPRHDPAIRRNGD